MPSDKVRDQSLDCVKGILIFLVVWGHFIQLYLLADNDGYLYDSLYKSIYSFHMPLFVFISGCFFKNSIDVSFLEIVKKQFNRLIVPQISFVILGLVIFILFGDVYSYKLCENGSLSIKKVYHFVTFAWYLWCIFFCTLFVNAMQRIFKTKTNVVVVVVCVLMWLTIDFLPGPLFQNQQFGRMLPCFYLGMLAKKHEYAFEMQKKKILTVCSFVSLAYFLVFILNSHMVLPGYLIRIPLQLFPMLLMFIVLKTFCKKNVLNVFLFWSRDTLFIYVFHALLLRLADPLHIHFSTGFLYLDYIFYGLIAILVCYILGFLGKVIRKNLLLKRFLLGEN